MLSVSPAHLTTVGILASALLAAPLFDARADAATDDATCERYEAEYALAANLKLADTFLGAGNGVFPTGPGKVVLRWSRPRPEQVAVEMVTYELHQPFTMTTSALMWSAKLFSNTTATATPDARGIVAAGSLQGRTIRWNGPLSGYRVDGTVQCEGSLCGRFGAPGPGTTEMHIPPSAIAFKSFELSPDGKTFTMGYVVVSHADSPKQTTLISLAGREMRRVCLGGAKTEK